MVKTKQQRRRDRKRGDSAVPPPMPMATVTSVTASGASQVTIVFAQPVQISAENLPSTWIFGTSNRVITDLVSAMATTYVFTVSGSVAAAQTYAMPGSDPAARTPTGGYVAAKSGTMS